MNSYTRQSEQTNCVAAQKQWRLLCNTAKGDKHALVQAGMLTGVALCAAAA